MNKACFHDESVLLMLVVMNKVCFYDESVHASHKCLPERRGFTGQSVCVMIKAMLFG